MAAVPTTSTSATANTDLRPTSTGPAGRAADNLDCPGTTARDEVKTPLVYIPHALYAWRVKVSFTRHAEKRQLNVNSGVSRGGGEGDEAPGWHIGRGGILKAVLYCIAYRPIYSDY